MSLTRQQIGMVAVLLSGAFIVVLNQTLLTPALPTIMHHLDVSATTVQWLTSGYSLVEAVIIPLNAFLLGRLSTRRLFIGGLGLFTAGSVLCASAPTFTVLLLGRVCQATATGALMPTVFAVILRIFPKEQRGSAMGFIGLIVSFAPAIGPSLSGALVDTIGWRALFALVVCLTLVVLSASVFSLKNFEGFEPTSFDSPSVGLLATGMVSLPYGLSTFTSSARPLVSCALMVAGAVLLGAFVWRQRRLDNPVLRVQVLSHREFRTATVVIMLLEAILIGSSVLMPMFIQDASGQTATMSGLLMLPGAAIGAFCGLAAGRLFDRFGIRGIALVGVFILLAGISGYFRFGEDTPAWVVCLSYTVACCGLQFLITPVNTWGFNSLPDSEIAHGNAIVSTVEQVGNSFGTAFVVSLTALSSLAVPSTASAAEQASAGCHYGFMGLLALALAITLAIVFFVRDGRRARQTA
ncbi:MAG: MDR family MFS transporter [Coriobacteriales bacterium]